MSTLSPQKEARLRQLFKQFNQLMILMWRLGLGSWVNSWPEQGGRIMVLKHRGRKTGKTRLTPVNYAEIDGDIYCTAGFGRMTDWYRNLLAQPEVEIWLPQSWWAGRAEDVSDMPDRLPRLRQVLINSGFAAPAVGVYPKDMSDETLADVTDKYRLVHIRRRQPCTGPGGPGDLAWIWPASTLLLLLLMVGQHFLLDKRESSR